MPIEPYQQRVQSQAEIRPYTRFGDSSQIDVSGLTRGLNSFIEDQNYINNLNDKLEEKKREFQDQNASMQFHKQIADYEMYETEIANQRIKDGTKASTSISDSDKANYLSKAKEIEKYLDESGATDQTKKKLKISLQKYTISKLESYNKDYSVIAASENSQLASEILNTHIKNTASDFSKYESNRAFLAEGVNFLPENIQKAAIAQYDRQTLEAMSKTDPEKFISIDQETLVNTFGVEAQSKIDNATKRVEENARLNAIDFINTKSFNIMSVPADATNEDYIAAYENKYNFLNSQEAVLAYQQAHPKNWASALESEKKSIQRTIAEDIRKNIGSYDLTTAQKLSSKFGIQLNENTLNAIKKNEESKKFIEQVNKNLLTIKERKDNLLEYLSSNPESSNDKNVIAYSNALESDPASVTSTVPYNPSSDISASTLLARQSFGVSDKDIFTDSESKSIANALLESDENTTISLINKMQKDLKSLYGDDTIKSNNAIGKVYSHLKSNAIPFATNILTENNWSKESADVARFYINGKKQIISKEESSVDRSAKAASYNYINKKLMSQHQSIDLKNMSDYADIIYNSYNGSGNPALIYDKKSENKLDDQSAENLDRFIEKTNMYRVLGIENASSANSTIFTPSHPKLKTDDLKLANKYLGDTLAGDLLTQLGKTPFDLLDTGDKTAILAQELYNGKAAFSRVNVVADENNSDYTYYTLKYTDKTGSEFQKEILNSTIGKFINSIDDNYSKEMFNKKFQLFIPTNKMQDFLDYIKSGSIRYYSKLPKWNGQQI